MAEIRSFPNNQDEYSGAEDVMRWLHGRTSGVFAAAGNAAVAALGTPGMAVTVSDGTGWFSNANGDGVVWWNEEESVNGSKLQLTIDAADGVLNRIDRVIVEWKTTNYVDRPEIKVLKGTASSTAAAPALTNNGTVRQISLAQIFVAAGTTAITASMITDERQDTAVCGLVTDSIAFDTSVINAQFAELLARLKTAIEQAESGALPDGSVTTAKYANKSVTLAKLAAEITAAALGGAAASHTHGAADIASGVLDVARIPVLDGTKIADSTIPGTKMMGKTLVGDHLADKTITNVQIADGTITSAQIGDGAVIPAKTTMCSNCAGAHNSLFRGRYLGPSVTAEQWAAIADGGFDGLYIGDYWIINNITWRIAAFDYYFNTGDTPCTTHHVVIVPDGTLYQSVMNDTYTTAGGYAGSKMRLNGILQAVNIVFAAFGSEHILSHRMFFCNAVSNGRPSGGSWYDGVVELMSETNVYGGKIHAETGGQPTIDKSQFPLFALNPAFINASQAWFWLRDVVSAEQFAGVTNTGAAHLSGAVASTGVRPAICIRA